MGTYFYYADGRRASKSFAVTSGQVSFVYDLDGHILGEYTAFNKPIREYVWLGDKLVAIMDPDPTGATKPPLVYYVNSDHLNTPRVVFDTNNAIRWRWLAEPFGTTAPETNVQGVGAFAFNLRMPGQYADAESGLFYNYFRTYSAMTGRYIQSDPIGLSGGINTYAYVGGNALGAVDPRGLTKVILVPTDDETYPAAVAQPDDPNLCIVISHGSPTTVNGKSDATQIVKVLLAAGCRKSQPVVLDSCRTGQGTNSIAEQLAKLWPAGVRAPTERVWNFGTYENPVPMPPLSEDHGSFANRVPLPSRPGVWRDFNKNGPVPTPDSTDVTPFLGP